MSRPTLRETVARLAPGTGLRDGLEQSLGLVLAKNVLALLEAGEPPAAILAIGGEFGAQFRESGWRSGLTMKALKANVDGLAKFWVVTDITSLLDPDVHSLSGSASFDLRNASTALGKLDQPTAERLADAKYLGKLDFIEFNLKDGMTRIDSDVGGAIGLGAGFSFADGD